MFTFAICEYLSVAVLRHVEQRHLLGLDLAQLVQQALKLGNGLGARGLEACGFVTDRSFVWIKILRYAVKLLNVAVSITETHRRRGTAASWTPWPLQPLNGLLGSCVAFW